MTNAENNAFLKVKNQQNAFHHLLIFVKLLVITCVCEFIQAYL